jgi:hypothetical protein
MPLIRVHHKSHLRPLLPEHPSSHQEPSIQICAPTEKEVHSSLAAHSTAHTFPFRETLKYEVALVGRLSSNRFAGRAPHVSEGHFFPSSYFWPGPSTFQTTKNNEPRIYRGMVTVRRLQAANAFPRSLCLLHPILFSIRCNQFQMKNCSEACFSLH